jgi:photoactive yellow protein
MTAVTAFSFDQTGLLASLLALSPAQLDGLDFGVIGFDAQGSVQLYNAFESRAAALAAGDVVGRHLFDIVAPCMNNFMVAQRFDDAAAAGQALDETLDYVLTLRMRPTKVRLRLLAEPAQALRFVCIDRRA